MTELSVSVQTMETNPLSESIFVSDLASLRLIGLSALISSPSMTCAVKINACVSPYLQDFSLVSIVWTETDNSVKITTAEN